MKFLNEHHVPTLLFTGNSQSELSAYATQTIAITQNEYDVFKVGTFASQITFEYLLDTLFAIIYSRSYKENLVQLQKNYSQMTENDILEDKSKRG